MSRLVIDLSCCQVRLISLPLMRYDSVAMLTVYLDVLLSRNCPTPLDVYIAREVADNVLRVDLKRFLQQETYPDEEARMFVIERSAALFHHYRLFSLELEASRLAIVVFNTLYDVCRLWSERLPLEKMRKTMMIVDVHSHAIKNTRRKMEDRHVMLPYFNALLGLKVTYTNTVQ